MQALWRINILVPGDPKCVYLFNIVFAPYVITYLEFSDSDAAGVNHPNRFCTDLFF